MAKSVLALNIEQDFPIAKNFGNISSFLNQCQNRLCNKFIVYTNKSKMQGII